MSVTKTVAESSVHVNIAWLIGIIAVLFGLVIALVSTVFWTVINNIKESIKGVAAAQKTSEDNIKITNDAYKQLLDVEFDALNDRMQKEEFATNELYNYKNELKDRVVRLESCLDILKKQHEKNHK